ncbi:hypothetical protein [Nocardia cyriacigeorgica]|uniref:hypothetical protein n=1 Tax=Nocardia cyriacigeorgica TaxID=135487 RepID=UPI002453822D|nr:hypothetical protein [Nocardia cyriacigeorgica]
MAPPVEAMAASNPAAVHSAMFMDTRCKQIRPRCGCGHDLALHDRETGKCHAEISRRGMHGMREWLGCNCRRYTGPTPLEDVFAPPILPPEA